MNRFTKAADGIATKRHRRRKEESGSGNACAPSAPVCGDSMPTLSLAPGFSRVLGAPTVENCLNSFPPTTRVFTRLKPGANERGFRPTLVSDHLQVTAGLWLALFCCCISLLSLAADTKPSEWRWQPSLVPHALLIEGLWTDHFRLTPALHDAGLRHHASYVSRSPYFGGYTRFYDLPEASELNRFSVIVIANLDAPSLNNERLKAYREFVANGGGLVVLGGYWAFSRGAYAGTTLEEMLPVTFAPEHRIPASAEGLPLRASPQATWKFAADFAAKPVAFYVQTLAPKPGATVQLLAGDKPALISGTFGKGRVVACALTANGDEATGSMPFWDWPAWPKVLGQALDWAAGARPAAPPTVVSSLPVLTEDELNNLALGSGVTPDMARRIGERPTAALADALFQHVMRGESGGKVDLASVLPTLLPFAKAEWGAKLKESLEKFSPDLKGRQAALILLGATRDPAALGVLSDALTKEETKHAAMDALGWLNRPEAIPLVRSALTRAEAACSGPGPDDAPAPDAFALQHGSTLVHAALALYRLGEPEAVPRMAAVYARVHLLHRIYENAVKRRVAETDLQGTGILKRLHEGRQKLALMLEKLRAEAGPLPLTQRTAFLQAAASASDPAAVEWLGLVMEQSTSLPAATWQPLTTARDGIIARMAKALGEGK